MNLSYNSRRLDGLLTWAQSDGVGFGWSLDTAEVVWRNVRRCWDGAHYYLCWDAVPLLVLNGEALKLVPESSLSDREQYVGPKKTRRFRTEDERYWRIEWKPGDENGWWEITTRDGTRYRFGTTPDSRQTLRGWVGPWRSSTQSWTAGQATVRWRLKEIVYPTTDAKVTFSYTEQTQDQQCDIFQNEGQISRSEKCFGDAGDSERASYLTRIEYPGSRVRLEWGRRWNGNGPNDGIGPQAYRYDYWNEGRAGGSAIFWQTDALQKIVLEQQRGDGTWVQTREWRFTYDGFIPQDAQGRRLRVLKMVQEWAPDGGNWRTLPPVTFAYQGYANKEWCNTSDPVNSGNAVCQGDWGQAQFYYPRLSKVENGYGGVISVEYQTPDRGWWQALNYRVLRRRVEDGQGGGWQETYAYSDDSRGRCYLQWPDDSGCKWYEAFPDTGGVRATGGTFVGYREVTVIYRDLNGAVQKQEWTRFALPEGPTNDPWPVRGRPREQVVKTPDGRVVQRVVSTYGVRPTVGGAHFVFLQQQDVTVDGRTRRTEWRYDGYGNVAAVFEHGFLDVTGDERSTHRVYFPNTGAWIVDRVAVENIYSGITENTGGQLSQTLYFYDGATSHTTPPIRGLLTRVDRGWGSEVEEATYDAHGNIVQVTDAHGNATTVTYDARGLYPLLVRNPLGHVTGYEYYGINESDAGQGRGPVGRLKRVVDPNGAATAYTYDAFGRLKQVIRPGDSWAHPSEEWLYYDGGDVAATDHWPLMIVRLVRGKSGQPWCQNGLATWERRYYDGLGRLVATQQPGTDWTCYGGGQEVLMFTQYDALGRTVAQSVPQLAPQYTYATTPDGRVVTPYQPAPGETAWGRTQYDVLGRPVRTLAPDGTEETTVYGPGWQTVVNARGYPRLMFRDAYGRLTRVDEMPSVWEDDFGDGTVQGWTTVGNVSEAFGQLRVTGNGTWSTIARRTQTVENGEGVIFDFRYEGNSVGGGLYVARGTWGQADYRRWGLRVGNGSIVLDAYTGTQREAEELLPLREGVWYRALLVAGTDGTFIAQVWERENPAVSASRRVARDSSWIGPWDFVVQMHTGTFFLQAYKELAVQTTAYTYDALGRLRRVVDARGAVTEIDYDPVGRKTRMSDPNMGTWRYTYDAVGNLKTQQDARGCVITFEYDALNRLIRKTYAGPGQCGTTPPVTLTYDEGVNGIGRRTGMQDGSGQTTWKYDARGRVVEEQRTVLGEGTFTFRYAYDAADRLVRLTYPDGEVVRTDYDWQGPVGLVSETYGQTLADQLAYDAWGHVTQMQLGNGVTVSYAYDPLNGRLQRIKADNVQDLHYAYDAGGNVTEIDNALLGTTQRYTYDGLDRLVSAETLIEGTKQSETYQYDAVGNLLQKGNVTYTYGDPARPSAVTALSNGTRFTYDTNGNVIQKTESGETLQFAYDSENRLVEVVRIPLIVSAGKATLTLAPETVARMVYDGDGQRVKATFDGVSTVMLGGGLYERTGLTDTKYYLIGGIRVAMRRGPAGQAGTLTYLFTDHLGSTVATQSGKSVQRMDYGPWGEIRSGTLPTERLYTGQRWDDALGLYFYNARYYDPALGRFIQPDTIVPDYGNPQALNRYAYVYNNPLRYSDPSGHWAETVWDIANIVWDIGEIRKDPGNLWNWGALALDVGAAVLPLVPGGVGAIIHGGKGAKAAVEVATHADEVADAARVLSHADEAVDALRATEHLSEAAVSLERFRSVGRESIPQVLESFGDAIRPMGDIPTAFEGRRVTTLGRTWDIEVAKELGGFRVLDDPNWSIERNYEWLMEAIENGDVFYLASPVTEANLWNPKRGDVTVYLRELDLLLQAGYRRVSDYLVPPH